MQSNPKSDTQKIIIAIDGYSSSGKSTMAKALAKRLGYRYIDSGAMYRAVALYALENDIITGSGLNTVLLIEHLGEIHIDFALQTDGTQHTTLNGRDVEKEIRTLEVSNVVSQVSAIPEVRRVLVEKQQAFGCDKGIVMDGRDIGTTVFPDAELKIFVNAPATTRAMRRWKELQEKGDSATYDEVLANVEQRDYIDTTRAESPLRRAEDAIDLDNSDMTIEQQNDRLDTLVASALNSPK